MDHSRNWLNSVDGRHKNERVALQKSRQILGILRNISSGEYSPKDLFNKSILRDHWLTKFGEMHNQVIKKLFDRFFYNFLAQQLLVSAHTRKTDINS